MPDLTITSPANPRVKELVALRRRRTREETGTTLVEGTEELALALEAGVAPFAVYHCPDLLRGDGPQVLATARGTAAQVVELSATAFARAAYREGPDGLLAAVPSPGRSLADVDLPPDALVLVGEGVEKPGNLGAMLRTADAAGVDLVVAADPVTDWGNPNVVRASKGTVFTVPVATAGGAETWDWLRAKGVRLVATTPDTERLHTGIDLTGPVAIAVGTEKHGLTDAALAAAQHRVRIPMAGRVNSLNLATSAAVVLYEAVRQRG